jgi:hypothetical protein
MKSKAFSRWLAEFVLRRLGWAPVPAIFQTVQQVLEGRAQFREKQVDLHVRVTGDENLVYYDLGDGRAACITPSGWSICNLAPEIVRKGEHVKYVDEGRLLFRRFSHQKPQCTPDSKKGDLRRFLEFVNLPEGGKGQDLLLLVWLVTAFIPGFPHPILAVYGPQGSAKSTLFRLLKELIDPSIVQTFSPSYNLSDFVLQASRQWFLPLDNLSKVPEWMSDTLCRICTGEGFSRRTLFEDVEETAFSFQRVIGINGINLVANRPDLLDRCLLLGLERVSNRGRLQEKDLWERFVKMKPSLLGAIFDAVSGAMRYYPKITPTELPRMADFARWGMAVARALGHQAEEFRSAYESAIAQQHEEAVSANLVAQVVVEMMKNRKGEWKGSPSELLGALYDAAVDLNIDTRIPSWPKEPNWVWRRLNEARTNLESVGIKVERGEDKDRYITIWKDAVDAEGVENGQGVSPPPQQAPRKGDKP